MRPASSRTGTAGSRRWCSTSRTGRGDDVKLRRIEGDLWEIPREGRMKVPGRVYSAGPPAPDDPSLQQVANVAHLPGILRFSLAMPDFHWGYGFPIGGVAAVDL